MSLLMLPNLFNQYVYLIRTGFSFGPSLINSITTETIKLSELIFMFTEQVQSEWINKGNTRSRKYQYWYMKTNMVEHYRLIIYENNIDTWWHPSPSFQPVNFSSHPRLGERECIEVLCTLHQQVRHARIRSQNAHLLTIERCLFITKIDWTTMV